MEKITKRIGLAILLTACMVSTASATLINVALGGTASQSSTGFGGVASRAIDGNTNGTYGVGSVTHTALEDNPWWEVDLGSAFSFDSIVVWNRTDGCCIERLNPFRVEIFDSGHSSLGFIDTTVAPTPSDVFPPFLTPVVQFVRVSLLDRNYLSLAEVQVFSDVPEPGSLALLGLGLAGLGFSRRKKVKT